MSSCMGGMNSHSVKEVHFNLMNSPPYSQRERKKQFHLKQKASPQVFVPIKNEKDETKKIQEDYDMNKILQMENIVINNLNKSSNNNSFRTKLSGISNAYIKKKMIENTDDYCDIMECEDDLENEKIISDSRRDILSEKRSTNIPFQDLKVNKIDDIELSAAKKENGGNIVDNRESKLILKNFDDKGNKNIKYNNNSITSYKIIKPSHISISEKKGQNFNNNNENNNFQNYYDNIKNSIRKSKDFNNSKIDNNISFNINNSNITNINNNQNNNMNNFNNISGINSDFNNNYIDISGNMTYFLSLEKSHRKPSSARFVKKNILSLNNNINNINSINNQNINNNASYSNDLNNNNDRNSVKINRYKWKLMPKAKYNTQIYKSIMNIPNIPLAEEGIEGIKNLKKSNSTMINTRYENNLEISEIKKQKEKQDKLIKFLENRVKHLEKKINEENINKINEKKILKMNLDNNKLAESQKDFKIKKLEEKLSTVKKNNKLNKTLLKQKEEQIKNLMEKKIKQDLLIKKYEITETLKQKNFNNNMTSKQSNKKISYIEDLSKSCNYNNYITTNNNITNNNNNSNSNNISNLSESINIKSTKNKYKKALSNKIKPFKPSHKKENSINIKKDLLKNNSTNIDECLIIEPEIEHKNVNSSMAESMKSIKNNSLINRSSSNISYNKYCNDMCNRDKNNYSNKIILNKKKIYKLNKSNNLSINNENKLNIFQRPSKKGIKQNKIKNKKEINLDLNFKNINININNENHNTNNNTITSKKTKKKFSFTKSKKFLKTKSEKDLKEMYLQAGTARNNDEIITTTHNIYTNSDLKLVTYNDFFLLTHKNSFTNSGGETTSTNKNNNVITMSLDEKLNITENINNINSLNAYLKSNPNEQMDKNETNKIYQNLWNEGYLRYKQIITDKKIVEEKNNENNDLWKLNFCLTNDLIELKVDKNEFISDIKNKFLNEFFKKKLYAENEKKYIRDNILLLNKEGELCDNKKIIENNFNENNVIIPVIKDMT